LKKNWPYLLLLALVLFILYKVSERQDDYKKANWSENYTLNSKEPYGCYVFRTYMDEMMDGQTIVTRGTCFQTLEDSMYRDHNYVIVNDYFAPSVMDVKRLLDFAHDGNNVMISARSFGMLEDTLKVAIGDPLYFQTQHDSLKTVGSIVNAGNRHVRENLVNPSLHLKEDALFDRTMYENVFGGYDTAKVIVLGKNGDGYTNFIRIPFGHGSFFLHTFPEAFGNYYAAKDTTSDYLVNLLSYLPQQPTFLDLHYKVGRVEDDDTRRYIFSEPTLRLAYMIIVISGLIGLFLGGRRRQRAVPVVTPPTNSTLEFVEQVGALYFNKGDHSDISHKKINYFLESLRSRFYIQTNAFDEPFLQRIENLSGVPKNEVRQLFVVIEYIRNSPGVRDKELKKLEELIRSFNNKSKR
jgi:hypothetical protein